MNKDDRPAHAETEPDPLEVWRIIFAWIADPKHANAITALVTFVIALTGIFYTIYSRLQWIANTDSVGSGRQSEITARDALVRAKPIEVKHRIVSPLNFDFVGASGPASKMVVEDTIETVGNGVALNVISWEDVIPVDPDISATSARKRQAEWCNANKRFDPKSRTSLNGYVLFPHDPAVQNSGMGTSISTIQKAVEANNASPLLSHGPKPSPLAGKVAFVMIGCVVYRSPLDPDGTRPYMTGFLYHLGEPQGWGGIQPFVTPKGTADKLQLEKFPDGDFAY